MRRCFVYRFGGDIYQKDLMPVHTAFGLDSEDGEAVVYAGTGR